MVGIDQGSGINLGIFLQELFASRKSASGLTSGAQALAAFFRGLLQDPDLKAQETGANQLFQGLRDMMNREYWTRISINQEVALAKEAVVLFATRAMYQCDAEGLELDLCTPDERNQGILPSWVIDWRRNGIETRRTWPINRSRRWPHYYATGEIDVPTAAFVEGDNQQGILRRYGCFVDELSYIWQYTGGSCDKSTPAGRERDKTRRLSSIIEFVQLPHTSGPGEDYVWRTLRYRYSNDSEDAHDEISSFIRAIMRQQILTVDNLTMLQKVHLNSVPAPKPQSKNWTVAEKLSNAIQHVQDCVCVSGEGRTLFKTQKGMFGLGHEYIQGGDIVTLIPGVH
ncbi:heterokaryon incompatibility protein [Fusarium subglutinans]|uniref:Heterokaryon incompatibility protein n=1 Tax=Gibberella subglutinans TaxID=42677 RepID=A0A8H5V5Z2_GIBSU|nr:heterokaryon incompatibility protein [Fusarium subglutinans]KAF5612272.1 heterokaryon incompatibility protein [Fusarium subglutinans]